MKTRKQNAFTLIELIVVIAIIALLVGIIGPSISKVRELGFKAKSTAAIQELASGAMQYKSEYNYYPLQSNSNMPTDYTTKASAAFGRLMLGYITIPDGSDVKFKSGTYERKTIISESSDRFSTGGTGSLAEYTPLDQWKKGDEMAVLYYPSALGNDGSISTSYGTSLPTINSTYTNGNTSSKSKNWDDFIRKTTFNNTDAYNADSFIMIAPGIDRAYFTDDDIKNF